MRNMPVTFGTRDLFEYDAKYSVLICRECKYAIQKSALGSHLLRHKIYRGERQRLLSSISRFKLLEPDHVPLPSPTSPPVDGLPIISGYRCTANGCESLCASSKRMKRHWSENHGVSDPPDSFANSVNLQTFFRGTKLRYFEVASPTAMVGRPLVTGDARLEQQHGLNLVATPTSHPNTSILPPSPPFDPDLETLRYFHHFTTTTSLTLPAENHGPAKYWQTDVVTRALRLHWLMCGLLAISASHLVALSDDEKTKRMHREQSALFLQGLSTGWQKVKGDSSATGIEEAKAGAQIICIQRCCHWTFESPALGKRVFPEPMPFQLQSFMTTVQGCVDPDITLLSAFSSDGISEETFVRSRSDLGGHTDAGVPGNVPPLLLERLRVLPYRMADILGKPDNALDVFATLSAIDALVECCFLSYASDDVGAVWIGMASWLVRLSDHFSRMLRGRSSAALIVLAHWSLLVERAELHCWFLRGSATKLLRQIVGELPENSDAHSLVGNLMG